MSADLSIKVSEGRFSYRVGAILLDEGRLLMVKNSGDAYYYTVGGRVRFGESAREAVLRETFEETGIRFEIDRLAFIHENFFTWERENEPFHEIVFFFLMKPNERLGELKLGSFREEYGDATLHWLPVSELGSYPIYPSFFAEAFQDMPKHAVHYVSRDGVAERM